MRKKTAKQTFLDRVIDGGGEFIAQKIMLQPSLDTQAGLRADRQREKVLRKRESRRNDREMGY